jgi:hypothetical protein
MIRHLIGVCLAEDRDTQHSICLARYHMSRLATDGTDLPVVISRSRNLLNHYCYDDDESHTEFLSRGADRRSTAQGVPQASTCPGLSFPANQIKGMER